MSPCSDTILLGLFGCSTGTGFPPALFVFNSKYASKISLPIAELIPDLSSFTHGTTTEKLLPDQHHMVHNRQELNYNIFSVVILISSISLSPPYTVSAVPVFPAGLYGKPLNVPVPVPSAS